MNFVAAGCTFTEVCHDTAAADSRLAPGIRATNWRMANNSSCDAWADTRMRSAAGSSFTIGSSTSRTRASAPPQVDFACAPDPWRTSGVVSRVSPSIQWYWNRPMSHIQ